MNVCDDIMTFLHEYDMGHCDVGMMAALLCKYVPDYATTATAIRQEPDWLMDHLPTRLDNMFVSWWLTRSYGEWVVARQFGHNEPRLWARSHSQTIVLQIALIRCAGLGDNAIP